MSRGQAHTLEGIVAGTVLLASLLFALQATTVTPLSASTSNEYIGTQLRGTAEGTLATGSETGSLKRMVLHWDDTESEFVGADEDGYYVRPPARQPGWGDFIDSLQEAYAGQGVAFNIYVQYERPGPSRQVERTRLLYQGEPTDNAVSASRTVTIYDSDMFNRAPKGNFEYTPTDPEDNDRIDFDASGSFDNDGTIAQYEWTLTAPDESTSTTTGETVSTSPRSAGKYTMSLQVTDDDGDTDTIERTVVVEPDGSNGPGTNKAPKGNFTHTPADPEDGDAIEFDASASFDSDGKIAQYEWTLTAPDGSTSTTTGETVNTRSLSAGEYTMSLQVTDNDGDTDTIERTVVVEPPRDSSGDPSRTYFAPDVSTEPPETPDTPLYTVITVEVVVWRL